MPHGSLALSTAADRRVDRGALLERAVEVELAHLGTHRGLRKLRRCEEVVADAVRCLSGIHHLHVEDSVDRHRDVVLRDALLRRHVDRLLLQGVAVGHAVEERHEDVEARVESAAVLAQSLDDVRRLLRHYDRSLDDRYEHYDRQNGEENKTASHLNRSFLLWLCRYCTKKNGGEKGPDQRRTNRERPPTEVSR